MHPRVAVFGAVRRYEVITAGALTDKTYKNAVFATGLIGIASRLKRSDV
jgi:hypothetical protein